MAKPGEIGGEHSDQPAGDQRNHNAAKADDHGHPRAVDGAGEGVSPEMIGAKEVGQTGFGQAGDWVEIQRIEGRDQGGGDGGKGDDAQPDQPEGRQLAAPEHGKEGAQVIHFSDTLGSNRA